MKRLLLALALLASITTASAQDTMTPEHFRALAATPGDTTPLIPQLSFVPYWTNAVVSNVMTYATGQVFREQMPVTTRSIGGKYLISTATSQFYHRPISSILAFDEKSSSLKDYALFPDAQGMDILIVGTVIYDTKHRTFSINSTYKEFQESASGTYSDTKTIVKATTTYKDGQLFMTRETTFTPVSAK